MRYGIMQPYFFPYLGHFDLIHRTDRWIVFDTAQYTRHTWMNRNRTLHPSEGWQYITAPVEKHPRDTPVRDVHVSARQDWRGKVLGQLQHYRRRAPNHRETSSLIAESLATSSDSLVEINVRALERVCAHLGITFEWQLFSEMDLDLNEVDGPGDWALRICQAVGATAYLNPASGEPLFDRAAFERAGIALEFQRFEPMKYSCRGREWIPNLSIVDVLMWNDPETILAHLDRP